MTRKPPRPNKKGEFLIDITPTTVEGKFTIYDLSLYLPHWEGYDRKKYMDNVKFSIKGKVNTVHIIDFWDTLDLETATIIAKEWFNGNTTYHRLD